MTVLFVLIHVGSGSTFLEVKKLQAKKIVLLSSQKIFMVDSFLGHRQKKTKSEKADKQTDKKQKGEKARLWRHAKTCHKGRRQSQTDGQVSSLGSLATLYRNSNCSFIISVAQLLLNIDVPKLYTMLV